MGGSCLGVSFPQQGSAWRNRGSQPLLKGHVDAGCILKGWPGQHLAGFAATLHPHDTGQCGGQWVCGPSASPAMASS